MPIGKDEFERTAEEDLRRDPNSQTMQILRFLAEHPDEAYTQSEIHESTGINQSSVGVALSRLETDSLVRHRGRYWRIGEDDRLASFAAGSVASSASVNDDYFGDEGFEGGDGDAGR